MAEKKTRKRRKKVEARSRGLSPREVAAREPSEAAQELARAVERDGGALIGSYRDPLGGHWQLLVALPIDQVAPTPFQRDLSEAHARRLTERIGAIDRFLDPIIAVRQSDGLYWTPNGNHRLHALRELGARSIVALLVPERELAFKILALNTEKAHVLREKALEVIRMARELALSDGGAERDHELVFEEPALLTLGLCYEQNGRFAGSLYRPILVRTDAFLAAKLPKALEQRAEQAAKLIELDGLVGEVVAKLKQRGFESPYLKSFVVARINPLRFSKAERPDFDATLEKMLGAARKFDAAKIDAKQLARSGGPPEE